MNETIRDFLNYLIDKQDCSGCRFDDVCKGLDDKKESCLCDKTYHSLYEKYPIKNK